MAIQILCMKCKAYSPTTSKVCRKCGEPFQRDRCFRVDVSVKGQRVTQFAQNLTIAREIEARLKSDMLRGEFDINAHKPKKTLTLGDIWEKFLEWAKEHKKTWRDDLYYYREHLEPRFAKKALEAITPFEIEKMKLEMKRGVSKRGTPFAAATIKHQVVLLRRLFNVARKWELYEGKNPVEQVQMPKLDNQQTEFLADEETERLLEVLETWPCRDSADFVKFAMLTGLRRGEIFRLKWEDLDFDRGMITLQAPKGGKTVTLPLSDEAMAVLRNRQITSPFVFPGKQGAMRADFKGPWERIRKAAGLPESFRFHGLRHNFASQLVSSGVDLAVVKELLSHKDMTTTQRYAHLKPDSVREAARKAGKLLTAPKGKEKVLRIAD